MRTFLSIDMDYWFCDWFRQRGAPISHRVRSFNSVMKKIAGKDVFVVESHEDLLPEINAFAPERIVHIDYHQDMAPEGHSLINCGSFLTFVKNREAIECWWHYPAHECAGADYDKATGRCGLAPGETVFGRQFEAIGLPKRGIIESAGLVGISISNEWCSPSDQFRAAIDRVYGMVGQKVPLLKLGPQVLFEDVFQSFRGKTPKGR